MKRNSGYEDIGIEVCECLINRRHKLVPFGRASFHGHSPDQPYEYIQAPHSPLWHIQVVGTPLTYPFEYRLLVAILLRESLEHYFVESSFGDDVIDKYAVSFLSLTINAGDCLVVVLKIPGDSEPDDVTARFLKVKTMCHGAGMPQDDGYFTTIKPIDRFREFLRTEMSQDRRIPKSFEDPFTVMIKLVKHNDRSTGQLVDKRLKGIQFLVVDWKPDLSFGGIFSIDGSIGDLPTLYSGGGCVRGDDVAFFQGSDELILDLLVSSHRLLR